ncbi:hypothetical protein EV363DRAFT_1308651 [Boletus edulis]|uniref:Uncharacterized protein n=1 Tax=Boletus edulis BED1 TaxID=1328754 RepID=A0AAD4C6D6_BOLED|nr:hypothetical protein EV363DRAFT_1308651 [Boletus edulis]KAF8449060.1 hypothetical protein L210DRAFT_3523806 [Boletus edulis BED1]
MTMKRGKRRNRFLMRLILVPIAPLNHPILPLWQAHLSQSSREQQLIVFQSAANLHTDTSHSRPQLEHDVDPPFMTDGRGRVVWSSTRNASGRGTAAEGRGSRHSRTGSTPRMACPSPSSALLVSNARGHAWGGQETQGADGKVEQSSDID